MVFELLSQIDAPLSRVEEGLYIGDVASSHDASILRDNAITAVVSLAERPLPEWSRAGNRALVPAERHLFVRCLDTPTQDLLSELAGICDFIDEMRRGGSVLVHCTRGVSRSAAVVVAYLMRTHRLPVSSALARVQQVRRVRPNPSFMAQLFVWDEVSYECWEDAERERPKGPYLVFMEKRTEVMRDREQQRREA